MRERDAVSNGPVHKGGIRVAEGSVSNRIGSYETTAEERADMIALNAKLDAQDGGNRVSLIQERNSFIHRDNAGRHESISRRNSEA